MKKILVVLLFVVATLAVQPAQAYNVPDEWVPQEWKGQHVDDVKVWILSEEHISDKRAQDNLRQLGQAYSNAGVSAFATVEAFAGQHGMAQLRAKMSYHATMKGYRMPILTVGQRR